MPGPGTYKPLKPIGSDALKFTIKSRLEYGDPAQMAIKKNVPGVGHYPDVQGINKEGKYNHISEWSNSKAQRWGPITDRFKAYDATRNNPGPGAHELFGETSKAS